MSYSYEELLDWNVREQVYPMTDPRTGPVDYHRLQIERWLWDNRDRMASPALEIGAEFRHEYAGRAQPASRLRPPANPKLAYLTVNTHEYDTAYAQVRPDVIGDVTRLPFFDNTIGSLICTETLEHVAHLFRAVGEIRRVLRPGGWAFLSAPFMWPTHDGPNYGDFWRITEQGWRFLFGGFDIHVTPVEMRGHAQSLFAGVAGWEVMGSGWECRAPTGYLVAARKPMAA